MLTLHIPTLFLTICVASVVCSLVMYINWRINQGLHGIKQWMIGSFCYTTAFLISITFPMLSIPPDIRITLNNTLALTALLCLLEGCLRFKGHLSERRWKWVFVIVPLVFVISWINSGHAVARHLFHDTMAIMGLLAMTGIMLRGSRGRDEAMVYGTFAFFSIALALTFGARLWSEMGLSLETPNEDVPTSIPVFVGLMLYTVGWTFSVTIACYYRATQTVRRMALEDSLTGLPNRRALDAELTSICRQLERHGEGFAVIVLDLNGFKRINDEYGHQAGDRLLIEVAERLRRHVRQSDFAGRIAGDEFMIILRNMSNEAEAQRSSDRLLGRLRGVDGSGEALPVGISAGLALWPKDGLTPSELLSTADRRMYADKAAGSIARTSATVEDRVPDNLVDLAPNPAS